MNNSKFRFTLNMHSHRSQVSIPALYGDTAVSIFITLTDGGIPYEINDGCYAVLRGKKADGTTLCNCCPIENNITIRYDFSENTTNCQGIVDCEISLYGKDRKLITSPKFIILVDERVVYDDDIPTSSHENNALDKAFKDEADRIANETARAKADSLRAKAESQREINESTRIANENERSANEQARVEAELYRSAEETLRAESETARISAELSRQSNEEIREANEQARVEAEAERGIDLDSIEKTVASYDGRISVIEKTVGGYDALLTEVKDTASDHDIRIQNLEGLTLSYNEDDTSAYEKAVPNGAAPYALMNSIGGNVCIKSKNYFDNASLGYPVFIKGTGDHDASFDGWAAFVFSDTEGMEIETPLAVPHGTYYLKVLSAKLDAYTADGANTTDPTDKYSVHFRVVDIYDSVHDLEDSLVVNDELKSVSVVLTVAPGLDFNHAVAVMVTDVETVNSYSPYEAPKFFTAPVTKVISKGSNLFDNTQIFPQSGHSIEQIPTGVRVVGYNQYATLTPEQFLEMTGLKEGDTFTFSAIRTASNGGSISGDLANFTFYGRNGYPTFSFGGGGNVAYIEHTRTIPTPFNSTTNAALHIFGWDGGVLDITNITITKGYKAAEYKPYTTEPIDTYTIPSEIQALEGYGMPFTTLDFDTKNFEASYGKVILNGTESWAMYEMGGYIPYFRLLVNTFPIANFEEWYATYPKTNISISNSNVGISLFKSSDGSKYIGIRTPNNLTLSEFKEWLSASPIEVIYKSDNTSHQSVSSYLIDYDEFKLIKVEGGGRIVFDNEDGISVPSTITYITAKE